MVSRICVQCGAKFAVPASVVLKGKGVRCSRACVKAAKVDRKQPIDPTARFWSKVDKGTRPDSCWLWMGKKRKGYGWFFIGGDKQIAAHRFAYELEHGEIPQGKEVLHGCDVRACVRHLHLGTQLDNAREAVERNRMAVGEAHGSARLTEAMVREIRIARSSGQTLQAIAERYSVHLMTISDIGRRKTWGWLE